MAEKSKGPLFPIEPGKKKPDYGTNDTLTLLEQIPSQMVEMKLDDVLTAVKEVDNLCDYQRCKTKTNLMGQNCDHCKKRFCFKHGLPEVHGCGEAVKQEERKNFLKPKPLKTVRQEQDLAKAKVKLNAKLKDMQVGRMPKPSSGGSGGAAASSGGGKKKKAK
ncbi:DNA-binding protein SMUBP-2 [Episyrphus balteatus]|uniref:DNA-binding protein SMUBP-2 n=1 Tax=Episyrphus balteatus TaxID=286459 RepID=UPI002485B12B|nr:DNA-binding protein SMUBP-2 [Episyrphus balteatus]